MLGKMTISENPAFDTKSLDGLRRSARDNSPESIKAATTQFEALFVNMMLKSMRQQVDKMACSIANKARLIRRCWTSSCHKKLRVAVWVWPMP